MPNDIQTKIRGFDRFLPLIAPIAVYAAHEIYFTRPKLIYAAVIAANFIIFSVVWLFCSHSDSDKQWWNYLILPSAVSTACAAYSVFLTSGPIIQLIFFLNLLFLYFYFRHIYYYLLNPCSYKVFSIENISSYAGWFGFFMIASVIYGLQSFLNMSVLGLSMASLAVSALMLHQIVWVNKIEFKKSLVHILVGCMILAELCWSISFLPLSYNISGLGLAICFYAVAGLVKNRLADKLDSHAVKTYLIIGSASLFFAFLTSKWI